MSLIIFDFSHRKLHKLLTTRQIFGTSALVLLALLYIRAKFCGILATRL